MLEDSANEDLEDIFQGTANVDILDQLKKEDASK